MKLLTSYQAFKKNLITEEQLAQQFGISLKQLRSRMTIHKDKLPRLLKCLDDVSSGEATPVEAAAIFGTTPRSFTATMLTWRVAKPVNPRKLSQEATSLKWDLNNKTALDVIAGRSDWETAAQESAREERTVRRNVVKLIREHGVTYAELKEMHLKERRDLAAKIELALGLDKSKKAVANSVAAGENTIAALAAAKVLKEKAETDEAKQARHAAALLERNRKYLSQHKRPK